MDHNNHLRGKIFLLFFCAVFLCCCNSIDSFEINKTIPHQAWSSQLSAKGAFVITDTVSEYNMYVLLRHTDAYKYNNVWLNIGLQYPGEKMNFKKVNLLLGNDQSGWEGIGMDDIWYVKKKLNIAPFTFQQKGTYYFSISNIMRDDPLLHVMSVGISVEKSSQ